MAGRPGVGFDVLFVCTANICRSPMAERLTRARLDPAAGVHTSSAGVNALVGEPMSRTAATVLTQLGGDPAGHVAEQVTKVRIEQADLLLAASSEHRDAMIRAVPMVWRRTFTMREFVRLGADLPPPRPGPAGNKLSRRVADVAANRGVLLPPVPGEDDIADPYGGRAAVMERCGQQISRTVDEILDVLGLLVLV